MFSWFFAVCRVVLPGIFSGLIAFAAPAIKFEAPSGSIDRYDVFEVTVHTSGLSVANPFLDAELNGTFEQAGVVSGGVVSKVEGFCDSPDGSVFRIRFTPSHTGDYSYSLRFHSTGADVPYTGRFTVSESSRKGFIRVDPAARFHFIWEGTGEHYFYNGVTAYFLAGWDGTTIHSIIDRYARLSVNHVRAAISGRVEDARVWFENVYPTDHFTFRLCPWVAKHPENLEAPEIDASRFNVDYWRKYEAMVSHARDHDVGISVVFYVDGYRPGADPFGKANMGGELEQRYYRYAIARLAAYSNVTWDIANEYRLFRNDAWVEKIGALIKERDPYQHLTSVHGHGDFRFAGSPWADFAMYQRWDESGGHEGMLQLRHEEARAGRPIPQVNEEYGYEDTYPVGWGNNTGPPKRSAENRRKLAWGMYMAGVYQTTGERASQGTGWGPDTGGGWVNGRGDATMTMLDGYQRIVRFFERFAWWRSEPHDELAAGTNVQCLAKPGELYAIYLPEGGSVLLKIEPGVYNVQAYNPRTGVWTPMPDAHGSEWRSNITTEPGDAAVLLKRR